MWWNLRGWFVWRLQKVSTSKKDARRRAYITGVGYCYLFNLWLCIIMIIIVNFIIIIVIITIIIIIW